MKPTFSQVLTAAQRAIKREEKYHVLVSCQDVRALLPEASKEEFDAVVLELAALDYVTLHHHDHPQGCTEQARRAMVQDRNGAHFVGFALEE